MPNSYLNAPLTGKISRVQVNTYSAPLMVPFISDEGHDHGEAPLDRFNRINDQVKSGKRRGAMILTDTHGLLIASGSKETDGWYKMPFPEDKTITPV